MSILFFTDPHIGLNRVTNTTPASRVKLKDAVFGKVLSVVDKASCNVCIGDLFDTYSNDEADLLAGDVLLSELDVCLAGNHDVTNRKDSIGSLQFLSTWHAGKVWLTPFGEAGVRSLHTGEALLVGVPHTASQELFEQSLEVAHAEAASNAEVRKRGLPMILLLHCNYECPFAEAETTLNLTEAWATKLLEVYDYVILGHEHQPRDLFGGRLVILGNTHPTSFADISDKRVAVLEGGKLTFRTVWSAAEGYVVWDHSQVPETCDQQFVRITGQLDAAGAVEISKKIATLWKNSPNLLAVKLDAVIQQADVKEGEKVNVESLPETIRKDLAGTDMEHLFNELLDRVA